MNLLLATALLAAQTVIPSEQLRQDVAILEQALESLHPGLYRYNDPESVDALFRELELEFERDRSLREAFVGFSRLVARVRCGHTHCNFWNQGDAVRNDLFDGRDKLPFSFRWIDRWMFVVENASQGPDLKRGSEILAINGQPVDSILDSLLELVAADGSNDAQRISQLDVTGTGEFEAFDVYFPMLFPPDDGIYWTKVRDTDSDIEFVCSLEPVSRAKRLEILEERLGPQSAGYDDLWKFELLGDRTAVLRLGSFVTWKLKLDWREFLRNAFSEIGDRGIERLILDVRGNAGGDDDVVQELFRQLIPDPVEIAGMRQLVRYERVPEELQPYLETWDKTLLDITERVEAVDDGCFAIKGTQHQTTRLAGSATAFDGRLILLVDASNSSASFHLANVLRLTGRATLIGQPTGGNLRGINGGQMFFLRLPHSGIEIDIPLIGYFPFEQAPDQGLVPDILVPRTLDELLFKEDPTLDAALRLRQ